MSITFWTDVAPHSLTQCGREATIQGKPGIATNHRAEGYGEASAGQLTRDGSRVAGRLALPRSRLTRLPAVPDGFSDLVRPLFQRRAVAAFEEQARFGFGARVAQEDAATLRLEFRFRFRHELPTLIQFFERPLFAHDDVGDDLREAGPALREFGERQSFARMIRRICRAATRPSPVVL